MEKSWFILYHYLTIEVMKVKTFKPGSYFYMRIVVDFLINPIWFQIVYNQIDIYLESRDLFIDAIY